MKKSIHLVLIFCLWFQGSLFAVQDAEKDKKHPAEIPPVGNVCYLTSLPSDTFNNELLTYLPTKDRVSFLLALSCKHSNDYKEADHKDLDSDLPKETDSIFNSAQCLSKVKQEIEEKINKKLEKFADTIQNSGIIGNQPFHSFKEKILSDCLHEVLNTGGPEKIGMKIVHKFLGEKVDTAWAQNYAVAQTVKLFLDKGADVREGVLTQCAYDREWNRFSYSLLMSLILKKNEKAVEYLLEAGVNPSSTRRYTSHEEVDPMLTQITVRSEQVTPLMLATRTDQPNIVKLLLKFKADPDEVSDLYKSKTATTTSMMTAMDVALEKNNNQMIQLLRDAGGKTQQERKEAFAAHIRQLEEEAERHNQAKRISSWNWQSYFFGGVAISAVCALGYHLYKKWKARKNKKTSNQGITAQVS